MATPIPVEEIHTLPALIMSNKDLQIQLIVLVAGLVTIFSVYFKFSNWVRTLKISYTRPHLSRFVRKLALPFFALALVSTTNSYIQIYELFNESDVHSLSVDIAAKETFSKILNSINILVIGYSISQIIPILLRKRESYSRLEEDYENWKLKHGFVDDPCYDCKECSGEKYGICEKKPSLFGKLFRWVPPAEIPQDFDQDEFQKLLKTEKGQQYLENYHTASGSSIGSFEAIVKDPFKTWKEADKEKYHRYLNSCLTGNNASGRKLSLKAIPKEIYPIDYWHEIRRMHGYDYVVPGGKPPGYFEEKQKSLPKSLNQIIPIGIFIATIIGVITWWGVDLVVLATATGGLGVGVGFALKPTMENYFAYAMIRKDKVIQEGDRIQLTTGFNGYVHRITPRVTYIRHALNESLAIVPTNQLLSQQILNYTKEFALVPATVNVGVSYLNDPQQVASILMKVGKRTMRESRDGKGKHMVKQIPCPYIEDGKASCGCDRGILIDISQPVVRFNDFSDSSLNFALWVYARDYGSHFKVETDMRMIMYEEFKKYDIRIPWPIRTIYQGDEKREAEEISKLDKDRESVKEKYGLGDISEEE